MHPYVLAELYPKNKDLKARWFVQWKIFDIQKGRLVTEQKRVPNKLKTVKERERWAKEFISVINRDLMSGMVIDLKQEKELEKIPAKNNIVAVLKDMQSLKVKELRKKSGSGYKSMLGKFFQFLNTSKMESIDINDFKQKHVFMFRDHLLQVVGNANITINKNVTTIGTFFKMAVGREIIPNNPFDGIKPLIETESTANIAFTKEHQILLEEWLKQNDPVLLLFTRFIYCAFIRPREIRELKPKDIDLKRKTITVKGGISKNKKTQTVPINKSLFDLLGDIAPSNNFLFGKLLTWIGKGQCSENYAYNRHKVALEQTGLESYGYTLYSWKHTGACRAIEAGVNPRKLQGLLRHSSLEETDTYLRSLGISMQNEELKEVW